MLTNQQPLGSFVSKADFELIQEWLKTRRAVISVVHDLSLAKAYGKQALLLHKGKAKGLGSIHQVLTGKILIQCILWMFVHGCAVS